MCCCLLFVSAASVAESENVPKGQNVLIFTDFWGVFVLGFLGSCCGD
jgi:hypothetical protein